MKLRHARAMAVFGIAIVALTGARGSSGGGCDNGSSGSSSSSSGGSTSGGSHDDVGKDDSSGGGDLGSGSTSSAGGSSGVGGGTGGGSRDKAIKDLTIESCQYTDTRGITARVRATNNSDETYDYKYKVTFTGPDGQRLRTANPSIPFVTAGSSDTLDTSTPYIAKSGEDLTKITCKLHDATRTAG